MRKRRTRSSTASALQSFPSTPPSTPIRIPFSTVGFLQNAHELRCSTFSVFLHPSWEKEHIERVIAGVRQVLADHLK